MALPLVVSRAAACAAFAKPAHATADFINTASAIMSNVAQLNAIKANTLAQIEQVSAERKPSYSEDGQAFHWQQYVEYLQRRVDWCNQQLAAEEPFEFPTQGYTP